MEGAKTFRDNHHKSVKNNTGNSHRFSELIERRREDGEIVVPSSSDLKDAEYFRKRAEEARTLAEEMLDVHTKSLMLDIAKGYEEIVKSYEKIANWQERTREPKQFQGSAIGDRIHENACRVSGKRGQV